MQRPPRPFKTAFRTILLAIGLPAIVFMFGAIRSRQLLSTANPRWAQFAHVTGPNATRTRDENNLRRISVRTASLKAQTPPQTESVRHPLPETHFTGSVTGRSSMEATVHSDPIPTAASDSIESEAQSKVEHRQAIIFRPVDDEGDSQTAVLTKRLESQMTEVRQRLDRLTEQQQELQAEDRERESRILEALKTLNDVSTQIATSSELPFVTASEEPIVAPPPPLPTSVEEVPNRPDAPVTVAAPSLAVEASEPFPTASHQPNNSPIRIRRSNGGDTSDTVSMDVDDSDIRQVFAKLSEVAQVSIISSPEIQGRVSMNLHGVRIEDALKAILKSRDYVFEREGDIIIVSTANEIARLKFQNRKLIMKIYRPSYLSAAELNRLIEPLLSSDGRHSVTATAGFGLAPTDEPISDNDLAQPETVIVQDVPEVLDQIDRILVDVDVPPLQVSIEAKILSVRLSDGIQHGIDLGQLCCHRDSGTPFAAGGLKHASLSCSVPTFVRSIERLADTSVVTSQRIQVLNQHRAEILIGDRIGFQSRAGGEVCFMEAGTRLILRPSISADGFIRLEIHPERSTVTMTRRTRIPHQNTTELTTQVMIRDGATVAIGGLISEQGVETTHRLATMNTIPVIGIPFRNRRERLRRTELIVLVTPCIVIDSVTEVEGKCFERATEVRAAEPRDRQSRMSRNNLARAHYDRASSNFQQGNLVKARQQINASLHQNKADVEALRLRNEIDQCSMQRAAQ